VTFLLPPETCRGPLPVERSSRMLGRGHKRPGPETVARRAPVPPMVVRGGRHCARPASRFRGYMSVCFGFIVRIGINQRWVCVNSVVLVRFAPGDPGVRAVSLVLRSASCAGLSGGAIPRRL